MGEALLNGVPFRIDPMSVSWDFTIKASKIPTVGGRVIQVYGSDFGDMQVTGTFGVGGWREQTSFLLRMRELGRQQQDGKASPFKFVYPPKSWDFLVYLKNYQQPGEGRSVAYKNDDPAPQWELTLFIVEDNSNLHLVAQDAFISRLVAGIGWKGATAFNGPITYSDLQRLTGGLSAEEYLKKAYGVGTIQEGNLSNE